MVALMAGGGSGGVTSRGKPHVPVHPPSQRGRAPRPQTATLTAFKMPAKPKPHPKPSKSVFLPSVGKGKGKSGGLATPVPGSPQIGNAYRSTIPHPVGGTGGSPYVNPFAGIKGLVPERIDQGVDFNAPSGSVIRALGAGKITSSQASGSGWSSPLNTQAFVQEKLSQGPLKGQTVYVAEDFRPLVKTGQTVKAGQPIGTFLSSSTGIEAGFGNAQGNALASGPVTIGGKRYPTEANQSGDPGAYSTGFGIAFSNLLKRLGGPGGVMGGPVSGGAPGFLSNPGGKPGRVTLPPSLPPIVIPGGVNPPASGGVPMPPIRLAAAATPTKAKAKRITSSPLHIKPTGPPVASPTGTTGTSTGTTTITSVTSSTAPPTFINSSTGTGGITPIAQPVASGTTGTSSGGSTLLLVAGAGVILVVILMTKKKGKR